jgi:hypothetical protein
VRSYGTHGYAVRAVHTSQETRYVSATEFNRFMLFGGTVAVYCEIIRNTQIHSVGRVPSILMLKQRLNKRRYPTQYSNKRLRISIAQQEEKSSSAPSRDAHPLPPTIYCFAAKKHVVSINQQNPANGSIVPSALNKRSGRGQHITNSCLRGTSVREDPGPTSSRRPRGEELQ